MVMPANSNTSSSDALKNTDIIAWRVMAKRRENRQKEVFDILNMRPRLRREPVDLTHEVKH